MDGSRFDALARSLSRRGIVVGLAAGTLLGSLPDFRETAAHDKRKKCQKLTDKDKRKKCLKQAKTHERQHAPPAAPPAAPPVVPPPPATTCPASSPLSCGANCCRTVTPLCCGDLNAPNGTRP